MIMLTTLVAALALAQPSPGNVETAAMPLPYHTKGGTVMEGWLAEPVGRGKGLSPAVLIVHDWNGIDEHEQDRARMFARHGYVALAVDIYGKGIRPKTVEACAAESGKYYKDPALWHERLQAGLDALKKLKGVDPKRIGAVGYCFGGAAVLEMARMNMDVKIVSSFHGSLAGPSKATKKPKARILEWHGLADPFVPKAQIEAFQAEMKAVKANFRSQGFENVGHSFAVKGSEKMGMKGVGYDQTADQLSWSETLSEFKKALR